MSERPPIALSIAGTDPSGGAGIHADLKTFTALGVLGTTAITALVAQNTHGVSRVYPIDEDFVTDELDSVLNDMPVDATKTGMLGSRSLVDLVVDRARPPTSGSSPSTPSWSRPPDTASSRSMPSTPCARACSRPPTSSHRTSPRRPSSSATTCPRRRPLSRCATRPGSSSRAARAPSSSRAGTPQTARSPTSSSPPTGRSPSSPTLGSRPRTRTGPGARSRPRSPPRRPSSGGPTAGRRWPLRTCGRQSNGDSTSLPGRSPRRRTGKVSLDPAGAHGPVDHQVDIVRR